MEGVLENIMIWFRDYKMPDGKPANKFGYDNKPQNKEVAVKVIEETHEHYQSLVDGERPNNGGLALV
jgi:inorganic pyrophosphatase